MRTCPTSFQSLSSPRCGLLGLCVAFCVTLFIIFPSYIQRLSTSSPVCTCICPVYGNRENRRSKSISDDTAIDVWTRDTHFLDKSLTSLHCMDSTSKQQAWAAEICIATKLAFSCLNFLVHCMLAQQDLAGAETVEQLVDPILRACCTSPSRKAALQEVCARYGKNRIVSPPNTTANQTRNSMGGLKRRELVDISKMLGLQIVSLCKVQILTASQEHFFIVMMKSWPCLV